MSKLLLLLLFALVQNMEKDGCRIYDIWCRKITNINGKCYCFQCLWTDGFYIRFRELYGNFWKVINYKEISYCLDDFGKEGSFFIHEEFRKDHIPLFGGGSYYYYKFKALRPCINKIALKFQKNNSRKNTTDLLVIKINIHPKDKTS